MIHPQHDQSAAMQRALSPAHLEYPQVAGSLTGAATAAPQPRMHALIEAIEHRLAGILATVERLEQLADRALGEEPPSKETGAAPRPAIGPGAFGMLEHRIEFDLRYLHSRLECAVSRIHDLA